MSTRAEEIAAELYYTQPWEKEEDRRLFSELNAIAEREQAAFVNGYKQGQQDRWISVESKLPEELPDGTNVLGWNSVRMEPVLATLRGGLPFDVWNEGWDHKNEITHWAPLPPNPEQR